MVVSGGLAFEQVCGHSNFHIVENAEHSQAQVKMWGANNNNTVMHVPGGVAESNNSTRG
jgi:hypothetical protein